MKYDFRTLMDCIIERVAKEAEIAPKRLKECLNNKAEFNVTEIESLRRVLGMDAITIDESWAGLYQNMSNTPQGKIIQLAKAGGNASPNSYGCKLSLPKTWVDNMGITPEQREVTLAFDGDRITVERPKESSIKRIPLASPKRIYCFALLWAQLYKAHSSIPGSFFEDVLFVGEGLADLGFEMDCGKSYCDAFSETAIPDCEKLQRQLPNMDIQTLGNLIFSQWRYWNHWSMGRMEEKDYQWFVLAFTRLADLARFEN